MAEPMIGKEQAEVAGFGMQAAAVADHANKGNNNKMDYMGASVEAMISDGTHIEPMVAPIAIEDQAPAASVEAVVLPWTTRVRSKLAIGVLAVTPVALVAACTDTSAGIETSAPIRNGGAIGMKAGTQDPNTKKTSTTEAPTTTVLGEGVTEVIAKSIIEHTEGMDSDDVKVGPDVDFNANPQESGSSAFNTDKKVGDGDGVLESTDEIREMLEGGTPKTDEARARVIAAFEKAGKMDRVYEALSGACYIPIAFTTDDGNPNTKDGANIVGTTYYKDGKSIKLMEDRFVASGDIIWICVLPARNDQEQTEVLWEASLRADCWNAEVDKVKKYIPGAKVPPAITMPPQKGEKVKYSDGIRPYNPNDPFGQAPLVPDTAGKGPAEQKPDITTGTIKTETTAKPPVTAAPTSAAPATTIDRGPATTNVPAVTEAPAVTAPASTTVENTVPPATIPPKPLRKVNK